jgi:hypothetical protein
MFTYTYKSVIYVLFFYLFIVLPTNLTLNLSFSWVECFGYLLLGCYVISVSLIICILILLLLPLTGLHFCCRIRFCDPNPNPRYNHFKVNIIIQANIDQGKDAYNRFKSFKDINGLLIVLSMEFNELQEARIKAIKSKLFLCVLRKTYRRIRLRNPFPCCNNFNHHHHIYIYTCVSAYTYVILST